MTEPRVTFLSQRDGTSRYLERCAGKDIATARCTGRAWHYQRIGRIIHPLLYAPKIGLPTFILAICLTAIFSKLAESHQGDGKMLDHQEISYNSIEIALMVLARSMDNRLYLSLPA
jgi:hypothetical protein